MRWLARLREQARGMVFHAREERWRHNTRSEPASAGSFRRRDAATSA
jgi:hypothetical protein